MLVSLLEVLNGAAVTFSYRLSAPGKLAESASPGKAPHIATTANKSGGQGALMFPDVRSPFHPPWVQIRAQDGHTVLSSLIYITPVTLIPKSRSSMVPRLVIRSCEHTL